MERVSVEQSFPACGVVVWITHLVKDLLPLLFWEICVEVGIFSGQAQDAEGVDLNDVRDALDVVLLAFDELDLILLERLPGSHVFFEQLCSVRLAACLLACLLVFDSGQALDWEGGVRCSLCFQISCELEGRLAF